MAHFPSNSNWHGALTRLAAGLVLATCCVRIGALEPTTPLANLNRQGWAMENGLPQNTVQALAQTKDGFLWMGTEVGLVRFDGFSFVVFDSKSKPALPGNDVQCLLAATDGSLWVGTSDGLARLKDGAVTNFTTANGLPGNNVRSLVQTFGASSSAESTNERNARPTWRPSMLWVWTDQGLARFDGATFVADEGPVQGAPQDLRAVTGDGANALWLSGPSGLAEYRLGRWAEFGTRLGRETALPSEGVDLVQSASEQTSLASKSTLIVLHGGNAARSLAVGHDLPGSRIQTLYDNHRGSLWIGTNGGLARYANGKLEKFPVTDPLASTSILSIFEDREGNLWVGTESSGLQILRDQRFHAVTTRDGLASDNTTAVVQDGAGTLWVGTAGNGITALKQGADARLARTYGVRDGLLSEVILSLDAAPNGDLWAGTADGLSRIRNGKVDSFTSADGLPDDFIRSQLADKDGSLWIGTRRGLTHWSKPGSLDPGSMETFTTASGLGSDLIGAMTRDANGDLWIATLAGLSRLHGNALRNYTTTDGLSSNVITALLVREDGALIVGTQDRGWNILDGERFRPVAHDNVRDASIRAILDDGAGHLWFATAGGIARCDCVGSQHSADCDHWLEFGTADGLRSRETAVNSHPSAWRAQNGHLWFATPKGLIEIDPAHFPVNTVPPPVVVERFSVDDQEIVSDAQASNATPKIAAGHNHFQFDYAGLSFVAPQKVRYRYMLEGFDHQWTEAGTRRTAYYTNIRPGRYTFRVQAANNDGIWNDSGAALAFELAPHFYQTIWFYLLLALVAIGLVLLVLRLRLLRAQREFNAVLGERNRIAREIHDTLAQGYVGISVQLEVLRELLRHGKADKAAQHLETVSGYVREGLADARQSIWALRSQDAGENMLPVQMRRLAEQSTGHGPTVHFNLHGAYRMLPPGTEREILRVAQEALHNVRKHAQAGEAWLLLEYRSSEVVLEVRDDGEGFEIAPNVPLQSPPGHFGLTGMQERAETIGATLEVTSAVGSGTTVRMHIPARGTHTKEELAAREQS